MLFVSKSKSKLLRATALAVVGGSGILFASQALAITASNLSINSVSQGSNNRCIIRWGAQITGTVQDAQNVDYFTGGPASSNGGVAGPVSNRSIFVGTTSNLLFTSQIFQTNAPRDTYSVAIFETPTQAQINGPIAASLPIPRADLIAAGGACARLAPNQAPVVSAGSDQSFIAQPGQSVSTILTATASDPDNDVIFRVLWEQIGGPAATIQTSGANSTGVTLPPVTQPTDFTFRFSATDKGGDTSTDTVILSLAPPNAAPTVDAGADQTVDGGTAVSLSGTASDSDNDPLTYEWVQVGTQTVTINNATSLNASFTAPPRSALDQTLTFELRANDGTVTSTDQVTITVRGNQAPTAAATAPTTISGGQTITLDGSGSSDPENDALIYEWRQTAGPSVTLNNANSPVATFVAPPNANSQQPYEFTLRVADPFDATDTATVKLTQTANGSPLADAGPDQTREGGSQVALDGSGSSDPDGDPLIYEWEQISGPTVTLSATDIVNPTFTAPAATNQAQALEFRLTVRDRAQQQNARIFVDPNVDTDTVVITIAANRPPVADAGPDQTLVGGSQVTLDGTGSSDPDGDALIYEWVQVGGPTVALSATDIASPTFEAPLGIAQDTTLEFQLTVRDRAQQVNSRVATDPNSDTDTVIITILANRPPEADAGDDQTVAGSAQVALDGSGSTDPDGDALFYEWVQLSGPTVTLSATDVVNPTFAAPASTGQEQQLEFQLIVRDRAGASIDDADTDSVVITIEANRPPVADAGDAQGPINGGETVTLNGSASSDPDGDTITYAWTQVSGTAVQLSDPTSASPTFVAPNSTETLVFSLVVSDGQDTSEADTVEIGIQAVGSITIVQEISGPDTTVGFTSTLAALNTSIVTTSGIGQVQAQNVAAGSYSVTAEDLTAQGYAITGVQCDDSDSTGDLTSRTVNVQLAAGEDVTCIFYAVNSRAAAVEAINSFLTGRNALILAHQPDLQRRLDRLTGDGSTGGSGMVNAFGVPVPGSEHLPLQASFTRDGAQLSTSLGLAGASSGHALDLWVEAHFSRASIGQQDADFSIIHIGADVKLGDDLLLGALVQIDRFSDRDVLEAGEAEGDGWMAGPYVMARLAPSLYAELRAAWGTSDNLVSPLAGMVDAFDTSRSLYSGSLVGDLDLGPDTQFRPELTLRYLSENQKAYTDGLGVPIPAQTVDQGDISFRPRISHSVSLDEDWAIRPYVEVEGIYTFGTDPDDAIAALLPANYAAVVDDLRGRVEAGFDLFGEDTIRATLSGFYDGIGADRLSDRGVRVGISFGF